MKLRGATVTKDGEITFPPPNSKVIRSVKKEEPVEKTTPSAEEEKNPVGYHLFLVALLSMVLDSLHLQASCRTSRCSFLHLCWIHGYLERYPNMASDECYKCNQ